jgi:hypothetical protein
MYFRPAMLTLFTVFLIASGSGCRKSESPAPPAPPTVLSPDTVASVHWVGKRRLDLDADAYYLSRVWSLPETARLQSQTFDKLATGSWRVLMGDAAAARIPAIVLRPLLEDLAFDESYLEVRAATNSQLSTLNSQPSFVLAIHVNAQHAGIWETNAAIALQLLTGSPAIADHAVHGWMLQRTNAPERISLTRVGDWTVLSAGPQNNALADDLAARIRRDGLPFVSASTNNLWLEADLAPSRLVSSLSAGGEGRGEVGVFSTLNHLNLTLSGDGGNVITRGQLTFAENFPSDLPSWHLPAGLVHEPLLGFTAVRGVQSALAASPMWNRLQLGAPDQFYLWSLAGGPSQTYLAVPLPDAVHQIPALADRLLQYANPWLAANGYISFDRASDSNGVVWGSLPDIQPFIKFAGTADDGWLYAGLFPDAGAGTGLPSPDGMMQDILHRQNLVYYDWELTGPRLPSCLYLGQTARQIFHQPQLPADSASAAWLTMLQPRLGTSATIFTRTAPDQLTFLRKSTLGLTAPELQWLAGWLESPRFPAW